MKQHKQYPISRPATVAVRPTFAVSQDSYSLGEC